MARRMKMFRSKGHKMSMSSVRPHAGSRVGAGRPKVVKAPPPPPQKKQPKQAARGR